MAINHSRENNWRTILTLIISILGIAFFVFQSAILAVFWLVSFWEGEPGLSQTISLGMLLWSSILAGLLLVPILFLSVARLRGRPAPNWLDLKQFKIKRVVLLVLICWPVLVLIGWLIAGRPIVAAFLLGPINVIVAGIPVLWIYYFSQRKLSGGPVLQKWQLFGFSLTVMPLMVIVMEIIAVLVLGGMALGWLGYRMAVDPMIERELIYIGNQLMIRGDDPQAILQFLEPYLLQPAVIVWGLAMVAGVIPLIEEILKPAALWFFAGREISEQEGFVGGLICGAGFALLENVLFFTTALTQEDWVFMAVSRASTGVLHMLASGLVGWGLVRAWKNRQWLSLVGMTLGAFLLHGIWNALAVVPGFGPLLFDGWEESAWQTLLLYAPLLSLLVLSIVGLYLINRYLRPKAGQSRDGLSSFDTRGSSSLADGS